MSNIKESLLIKGIVVGAAVAAVGSIWNITIGTGILLGLFFGTIHHLALQSFYTATLQTRSFHVGFYMLYFIGNTGMIMIPLYIGSVYPNKVNVFGAAFGLLLHKLMIYVEEFVHRRKEE